MGNTIIKFIGTSFNVLSYVMPKYTSIKALDLFATPRRGHIKPKQLLFLDTAERLNLKYKDTTIATYHWKGNGTTILLVHGWESNTQRWEKLIHHLQKLDYNIVSLDAPAHGASSGKQFNAVLYSECINVVVNHFNPEIIIGHSVGGMATGFFQYNYQNKNIKKLVFLGAPAKFADVFKRYVDMMSFNKRIEDGLNNLIVERFNKEPSHFSLANFAKTITTKTLVVHDTEDKIIPYNDAKLITEHHNNAEFVTTTGYGHGLRNDVVYKHILDFISS